MGGMKPSQRHGVEDAAQKKLAAFFNCVACFLSTEPEEEEEVKSTSTMTPPLNTLNSCTETYTYIYVYAREWLILQTCRKFPLLQEVDCSRNGWQDKTPHANKMSPLESLKVVYFSMLRTEVSLYNTSLHANAGDFWRRATEMIPILFLPSTSLLFYSTDNSYLQNNGRGWDDLLLTI